MWFIGKIRESMESIPLELSRFMEKSEEDIRLYSKASFTPNLPKNILTPDKIPEFCLPPQLCRSNLLQEAAPYQHGQTPKSSASSNGTKKENMKKNGEASVALQRKKPLPFSAEAYGLVGMYERPNTRRKESLFHHSKCPTYMLDRSIPAASPKLPEEKNQQKKTLSGLLPLFLCKSLSETGSTESETHSSSNSSPLSSPFSAKSSHYSGRLKGATSCPSLIDNMEDRGKWKRKMGFLSLTTSPSSPPKLEGGFPTSAQAVPFPLPGQEIFQREHLLSLHGRGKVHLLAELTTFSPNNNSYFSTVRIRVMSVEGIHNQSDRRALNCALTLCLTPGMLQQQESTSVRNCRSPVFNEDFFFTGLSKEDLVELQLRLKVVDKPAVAAQRRGVVIGLITTPLSQLLNLNHG